MLAEYGVGLPFDRDWLSANHAGAAVEVYHHLDRGSPLMSMLMGVCLRAVFVRSGTALSRMGDKEIPTEFDQSIWIAPCHGLEIFP